MKLVIPNNIFATLFVLSIDKNIFSEIIVKESSLISTEINNNENVIGLMPSFDLINNRDFFISSKLGLGFEGLISNTYIYYNENQEDISKLLLRGDISTNEVILSKILFQERYNIKPEIILDSKSKFSRDNNYILVGSENWTEDKFKVGTSFSEQLTDLMEFPYINFVFASQNENIVREFNSKFNQVLQLIINNLDEKLSKINFSNKFNDFLKENISAVYFDFTHIELEGLKELIQLAYFHQILDDIFDIKIV
ncbi:MAG: hypothetical protein H6609_15895 [Ignavibacteriales bacterium]|nr:hypothetical protein [Ignavibacteriales bacterium]